MRPNRATAPSTIRFAASPLTSSAAIAAKFGCEKSLLWMDRDTPIPGGPAARNAFVTELPSPPFAPVISATLPPSELMIYSPDDHATRNSGYRDRKSVV